MALNYAKFLDKNKFEVITASCVEGGELEKDFATAGAPVWVGSRRKMFGRLGVWYALAKFTKEQRPDILHTHLFGADLVAWILKKVFRIKFYWVVTVHNRERGFGWWRMHVWKMILRSADKIIAVSAATGEYVHEYLDVSAHKMTVINNGIDLSPWLNVPAVSESSVTLRLAVVGRLTKQKGQEFLWRALANLKHPWQLGVFGTGEDEKKLNQLAQKLNIADKIIWHGLIVDWSRELADVNVVVAPALWEGLSLVVMESMTAGKAVVASLEAGQGLIENNITGLLVRPGSVGDLFGALESLSVDHKKIKLLGNNARAYAKKYFDIKQNTLAVEKVYWQILSGQK